MKSKDFLNEKWSQKYKRSINCASPKGFSQRAHCAGRNKNESIDAHIGEQQAAEGTIITKDDLVDIYIKGVGKNKMPIQKKIGAQIPNSKVNSFIATVAEKYGLNPKAFVYGPSNPVAEDRHPNDRPYAESDDDDVFSDRKRLPPKNLHALLQWAGNDPEKRYFRLVAEFGIKHKLNLAATLETLSDFDAITDADLEFTWGITDEREAVELFNAYEHVFDAWTPAGYDGEQPESDYWTEGAEAELEEPPERPRKTTTKTKPDIKFDIPFQQDQDHPLAKTDPLDDLKQKAGLGDEPKVNIKKANQKTTLSKTAGIGSDDMANMLGKLRNIEVDRDLEAYPDEEPPEQLPSVEVNTANLPAVAGQALQAAGVQNPDFHQVANLPGNMADQIRQLGKSLFGSLTMTPTKRIHVVANLGGQGPNTSAEVNAVAGFLKDHGRDLGPGDIDFENVMPGYKAQTHMFSAAGIRWMLVKDFAGQYIYCWPEEDSHDAQDAIGMDKDVKKLR